MLDKPGIYKITNLVNGKLYIGSSRRLVRRMKESKRDLAKGSYHNKSLQLAWNRHGSEAFKWEALEYCSETDRLSCESRWIKNLNAKNREYGYNYADPTDAVALWTDERRKIQSENAKSQWHRKSVGEKQEVLRIFDKGRVEVNSKWDDPNSKVHKVRQANLSKGTAALAKCMKDPEWRAKRKTGSKTKELWKNPEYRKKMLPAFETGRKKGERRFTEIVKSAEFKEQHSLRNRKLWADQNYRQRQNQSRMKVWSDPEYRLKQSEARKLAWSDPEKKALRLAKQAATKAVRKQRYSPNNG